MRVRENQWVAAFPTTTAALHAEEVCHANGVPGRLIPLPARISAGCGLAWAMPESAKPAFDAVAPQLDIQVLCELML